MPLTVTTATVAELDELADVAARTFPLACPPSSTPDNVAAFIDANLSPARFAEYLADPDRVVLTARDEHRMVGYAMLVRGVLDDADVQAAVTLRPAVELSKMYVLPDAHGAGASAALMNDALARARTLRAACVWLGVNQENQRAQRFYAKHGFAALGTKTFRLGATLEHDYVMVCPLAVSVEESTPAD
jgi:ribosomal protein S18 acetylase RimI-like enzyme